MHLPQHTQVTGGRDYPEINAGNVTISVLLGKIHTDRCQILVSTITDRSHGLTVRCDSSHVATFSLLIKPDWWQVKQIAKARWVSLTPCRNMKYGEPVSSLRWARCRCQEHMSSSPSGPWQSSCKRRAWIPEPAGRHEQEKDEDVLLQGVPRAAAQTQRLTPTFRSKSLTMLRADILAEGVNGQLLPYPFESTVITTKKQKILMNKTKHELFDTSWPSFK